MIIDSTTNYLYFADTLPKMYPTFYTSFLKVLNECKINFELLQCTKDVWAVDYMPIQIETDKFIQFDYKPDYLYTKKERNSISDVDCICKSIGLKTIKSDIILDGGNVVRTTDKVIMCDKIIFANQKKYSRKELIKKLHELFQVDKLFFIPQDPHDEIGHADGMVRFINENKLIVNDYTSEQEAKNKQFVRAFYIALDNTGIEYATLPYNPYNNQKLWHANGIYINYLQMKDVIILPTFGINEDEKSKEIISKLFPNYRIETINSNEIAFGGGVLNCITWNIMK